MFYNDLNSYLKTKYGVKIYKLSIDGGLTCPNRDGTLGTRGCIFCSDNGSGEFAETPCGNIAEQLEKAKKRVESKNKDGKYIAYFQSFTNTYGDIKYLERIYREAIAPDYIVGLSVATRPDCLGDEVISLLSEINKIKPVSIELGLQTIHQKTADYIRRGYKTEVFDNTVKRLKAAGIETVAHLILGLPGESEKMMLETVNHVGKLGVNGVKFHLLYIIRGTDLEKDYKAGLFSTLGMEEYVDLLEKCIKALPKDVIIHRLTGDGAKRDLIAPLWSADKKKVLNYIKKRFESDCLIQGSEHAKG